MSQKTPVTSGITVVTGSIGSHTGKWMEGFTPPPNIPINTNDDTQKLAAKLWVQQIMKKNPSLLDSLKKQHLWSCRDNELVFWQAVAVILQDKGSSSPNGEPEPETIETKPGFPSDEELVNLDHQTLLNLCEELAQHYPFLAGKREEFDKKDVFSSPENTRIFLNNMRHLNPPVQKQKPTKNSASTLTPRTALDNTPLLVGGLSLKISSSGNDYLTEIFDKDEVVVSDKASIPAFKDPRAAGRISHKVKDTIPDYDQKRVKESLDRIFKQMSESPDAEAIMTEQCADIIQQTVCVNREMTDPPRYHIEMADGTVFTLPLEDFIGYKTGTISLQWAIVYNQNLKLKDEDFKHAVDYWFSISEDVDPIGSASEWEPVADEIINRISVKTVSNEKGVLLNKGLYQETDGPLWVSNGIIHEVTRDFGVNITDSRLTKYLEAEGYLVHKSKVHTVNGRKIRAWGFDPGLRDNPSSDSIDNTFDEPPERVEA